MSRDERWKMYYEQEDRFFKWVNKEAEKILEILPPEYTINDATGVLEPPKYVRGIYRLAAGDEMRFAHDLANVKACFNAALEKPDNQRFPLRMPTLYYNVQQINLTQNAARSSIRVPQKGNFRLLTVRSEDQLDAVPIIVKQLRALHIDAFRFELLDDIAVLASCESLLAYAGTQNLRAHRDSGTQFRARIRKIDESTGTRARFGFMVLDHKSLDTFYFAPPQAARPHRIAELYERVEFPKVPVELDFAFYKVG